MGGSIITLVVLLSYMVVVEARCLFTPDANGHVDLGESSPGITTLEYKAFWECDSLKSVTLPSTLESIGYWAFGNVDFLSKVTMTTDSNLKYIGVGAFYNCPNLNEFEIPSSVLAIGNLAFTYDVNLRAVTIPIGMTQIGNNTFAHCRRLTSVAILGSLTKIGVSAFEGCLSLSTITVPNSVESIGVAAFRNAYMLESINLGTGLASIGAEAFLSCGKLDAITLPSSLTTIGAKAFQKSGLTSVVIPDSVINLGSYAFSYCSAMKNATIGNALKSTGSYTFTNCTSLQTVNFGASLTMIGVYSFSNTNLLTVSIPKHVNLINTGAFYGCSQLQSVTVPDGLVTVGNGSFSGCTSLSSFNFPTSITSIGMYSFYRTALKEVYLADEVKNIGKQAFRDSPHLVTARLPSHLSYLGDSAFLGCSGLKSITMPKTIDSLGTSIFYRCNSLESLVLPSNTKVIPNYFCFECSSLKSVTFPSAVERIKFNAFYGANLTTVTLPANCSHVDGAAFGGESLETVVIDSVNLTVSQSAFISCPNLKPAGLFLAKNATLLKGLPSSLNDFLASEDAQGDSKVVCKPGHGNGMAQAVLPPGAAADTHFNCIPCEAGSTSTATPSREQCVSCEAGRYSTVSGSPFCTTCESGKYSDKEGASLSSSCQPCKEGTYAAATGSRECLACPPGSVCDGTGLSVYTGCLPGSFQPLSGQKACRKCQAGRYTARSSSVACEECNAGKTNPESGSQNASMCLACVPGRFASQNGTSECERCAKGTYQASHGMTLCISCEDTVGNTYTSNAQNTACEVDQSLLSKSLVDIMFDDGVALGTTFSIAALFVAVGLLVTYYRECNPSKLANYSRLEAFYNALMAGFSFGAELFLVAGILPTAPGIAVTILLARLSHFVVGVVLVMVLFGPLWVAQAVEAYLPGIMASRENIDDQFSLENVYIVESVALLTFCDVSMLQFMPWKKNRFFALSEGYPTMHMMRVCVSVKTVQTFVSVVCEIAYLSGDLDKEGAINNGQALTLFYTNLIFGIVTVIMDILVLCLRGRILEEAEKERVALAREARELEEAKRGMEAIEAPKDGGEGEGEGRGEGKITEPDTGPAPGFADLYGGGKEGEGGDSPSLTSMAANPMHARRTSATASVPIVESAGTVDDKEIQIVSLRQRVEEQSKEIETLREQLSNTEDQEGQEEEQL